MNKACTSWCRSSFLFASLLYAHSAAAHHGVDFLTVQTAHVPEQGNGYALGRADYIAGDVDETEFEPALLYGVSDWMSAEVHAHIARQEGESFEYESIAPALNFRLTPRHSNLSAGFSAEYEFQRHADQDDVLGLTLMSAYSVSNWMVAAHARMEKPSSASPEWKYAAGVRRSLNDRIALGLELNGSLETRNANEWLLGFYGELTEKFTVNAGLGTGPDEEADWSLRTAFIWRFR